MRHGCCQSRGSSVVVTARDSASERAKLKLHPAPKCAQAAQWVPSETRNTVSACQDIHYSALRRRLRNKVQIYYCSGGVGGWEGGWGITTTVLCVPQLLHRLQTIFHLNIRMSLFFLFGSERVMKSVFLWGGVCVCFHSGSRSSAASGTQAVGIRWFLSATGNQKYILLAVVREASMLTREVRTLKKLSSALFISQPLRFRLSAGASEKARI